MTAQLYHQTARGSWTQANMAPPAEQPPLSPYERLAVEAVAGAAQQYRQYWQHRRLLAWLRLYWKASGPVGKWPEAFRLLKVPAHMQAHVQGWFERPPHRVRLPLLLLAGTDEDGWAEIRRRIRRDEPRTVAPLPPVPGFNDLRVLALQRHPGVVRVIRQARRRGATWRTLGARYGIAPCTAKAICRGG